MTTEEIYQQEAHQRFWHPADGNDFVDTFLAGTAFATEYMMKFAEWVDGKWFRLDDGFWTEVYDTEGQLPSSITTAALLALYAESQSPIKTKEE